MVARVVLGCGVVVVCVVVIGSTVVGDSVVGIVVDCSSVVTSVC